MENQTPYPDTGILFCDIESKEFLEDTIKASEEETILRVNDGIGSFQTLEETFSFLLRETQNILPADILFVAFFLEEGKRAIINHAEGAGPDSKIEKGLVFDMQGSIFDELHQWRHPMILTDTELFFSHYPGFDVAGKLVEEKINSVMICPLQVEGRTVGFIFRGSRERNQYSIHSIRVNLSIHQRLSEAMEKTYMIEQLSEAVNSYMEMLSFVSHEMKSPLDSIISMGDTIVKGYFGPVNKNIIPYIQRMINKARFLRDVSYEYLTLANFENGTLKSNPSEFNFYNDVLNESIEIIKPQLRKRKLKLNIPKESQSATITGDPVLLKIAANNLLSNAVKYSFDAGIIIISLVIQNKELILSVHNEGPGFSVKEGKHLFQKFSRLDKSDLLERRGTGIGLYITWRIIQLHKGFIHADSREGEWAEFTITLPL